MTANATVEAPPLAIEAEPVAPISPEMPTKASQIVSLLDALDMMMKLASGFTMRADFHVSPEGGMNAAGRYMSDLSDDLCNRYLDTLAALRDAVPIDAATARRRRMILAIEDMDQDNDALELVAKFTARN
jgi:hypothetical protein